MATMLGALILGVIAGVIGTKLWMATPTGQVAAPTYFRRIANGQTYRFSGRGMPADEAGEVWLMTRLDNHHCEVWPERRVAAEFEKVDRP